MFKSEIIVRNDNMNKRDRIKLIRKLAVKHGNIVEEYRRCPDRDYAPYRKGSYYLLYHCQDESWAIGGINKYKVYKTLYNDVLKRSECLP